MAAQSAGGELPAGAGDAAASHRQGAGHRSARSPQALLERFHELLHDHRGGRQGFPLDVLMELLALREALIHDDERPGDDDATPWVS